MDEGPIGQPADSSGNQKTGGDVEGTQFVAEADRERR